MFGIFKNRVVLLPTIIFHKIRNRYITQIYSNVFIHSRLRNMASNYSKYFLLFVITILTYLGSATAQDIAAGKALFTTNCASCHNPLKDATGPALKDMDSRVPSKEWLYAWVKNPMNMVNSGDKYANEIYNKWNKVAMTAFANLSHEDIDNIVAYVNSVEPPVAKPADGGGSGAPAKDNSWLYAIVTIILVVLAVILSRVNRTLNRLTNDKEGLPNLKEVPIRRNKVYLALGVIVLLSLAGYWIANGAIEMHRQQNYMPEQPIFYSHKVHAGINQINCQYCHSAAEESRQAMIPSSNVCMNCHKQINEYTGEEKLYTYEGKEVDGTAEIHKLYAYAGWDPVAKAYKRKENGEIDAKPIPWVKVHNMPDHVYFNHAQHVAVGKVQCQSCHGPVQDMDEVYQFSPLSMGWCINCHRNTEVQFMDNDYYKIYQKYHQEIKDGKRQGVTEAEMGGTECQKCHY